MSRENRYTKNWIDDESWLLDEWENNKRLEEQNWKKRKKKNYK